MCSRARSVIIDEETVRTGRGDLTPGSTTDSATAPSLHLRVHLFLPPRQPDLRAQRGQGSAASSARTSRNAARLPRRTRTTRSIVINVPDSSNTATMGYVQQTQQERRERQAGDRPHPEPLHRAHIHPAETGCPGEQGKDEVQHRQRCAEGQGGRHRGRFHRPRDDVKAARPAGPAGGAERGPFPRNRAADHVPLPLRDGFPDAGRADRQPVRRRYPEDRPRNWAWTASGISPSRTCSRRPRRKTERTTAPRASAAGIPCRSTRSQSKEENEA